MLQIGRRIEERGIIAPDGDRLIFRPECGGRWLLEPGRVQESQIGQIITMRGVIVGDGFVLVEAVDPAS